MAVQVSSIFTGSMFNTGETEGGQFITRWGGPGAPGGVNIKKTHAMSLFLFGSLTSRIFNYEDL